LIEFKLMEHQKKVLYDSQFQDDVFLAWEMGTGKSCATIQILRQWYQDEGRLMRTLILAPLITLKNWKKEFEMFSRIPQKVIYPLEVASKRVKAIQSVRDGAAIFVLNYDALSQKKVVDVLKAWGPEVLICDESHYLKNYKSKRAKVAAEFADRAKKRVLLTGTPILNNALDLFMQFRVMDGCKGKDSTFGSNFFAFRATYFEDENAAWNSKPGHFPKWVPRPATYATFNKIVGEKVSRIRKEDVLDLPDLVTEERYVSMSKDQLKVYQDMKRDFVAYVEGQLKEGKPRAVVAKLAITKALRLQQIVSGAVKDEQGDYLIFENNPRLDDLRELLTDLTPEHKVIVWAVFKPNYAMIRDLCEDMGIGYVEIHGDVPNKEKFKNADLFNTDERVRVLIGNPAAGGVGINLVGASYSIYYSRSPKLGDDLQSEARNYRKGSEQHEKITRINLVCPGTIDELINDNLAGKLEISEAIIDKKRV